MLIKENILRRIIREELTRSMLREETAPVAGAPLTLEQFRAAVQAMPADNPNRKAASDYLSNWDPSGVMKRIDTLAAGLGKTPCGRLKSQALKQKFLEFAPLGINSPLARDIRFAADKPGNTGSMKTAEVLGALLGDVDPKAAFDSSGNLADQMLYLQSKTFAESSLIVEGLRLMASRDPKTLTQAPKAAAPASNPLYTYLHPGHGGDKIGRVKMGQIVWDPPPPGGKSVPGMEGSLGTLSAPFRDVLADVLLGKKILQMGSKGEDVKALQMALKAAMTILRGGETTQTQGGTTTTTINTFMKRGMSVEAAKKFSSGTFVDGDFGPATFEAVKAFQRLAGLTVDGRAGQETVYGLWGRVSSITGKDGRKGYVSASDSTGTQLQMTGDIQAWTAPGADRTAYRPPAKK